MPHKPGTKMRKADFEIPYPWSETVKYSRRYRDGWFDAYQKGVQTDKAGKYNSRGRDAYLAGFAAGYRHRPLPSPAGKVQELAPPQPSDLVHP